MDLRIERTYWKLETVSKYAVAIQLVFSSASK